MENRLKKISGRLTTLAVALFFCSGFFYRCAIQVAPTGGPKDTLPPKVLIVKPENFKTGFAEKRVTVEFDEYINLKDQMNEVYTSPFMKHKPIMTVSGRRVLVDIQDTLAENTTYAINFGNSIVDNNEGNPLYGFRYVFSTGGEIDSLMMSGMTVDAEKGDSVSRAFILFYEASKDSVPAYDSTMFKAKADVVARAENNGIFFARELKPINYRIYAFVDNNRNQTYDPGVDLVGFTDGVYNPADMPGFNAWFDTMRHCIVADPQIQMRMFKDEQFKRQRLGSQKRPQQHLAVITFGAPYPQIKKLELNGIAPKNIIREYLRPERDSIALWLNVPSAELPDTIRGELVYMKHDSLNELRPDTQKLSLVWRIFESKTEQKARERVEKEREELLAAGKEVPPEPNPFKYSATLTNMMNPENNIQLTFDYPLVRMDSSRFSLVRLEDDKQFRVPMTIERDTMNIRKWTISAKWANNNKYSFTIPAGALQNVAGQMNDTLKADFTVADPGKYGTLVFRVKGKTPQSKYVLQLTDESGGRMIKEVRGATTGEYTFRYVDPGKVMLRVIEDMNGNGVWDKGNLVQRRQPERTEVFVQESGEPLIESKVNWELAFDVDMNKLFAPVTMEVMMHKLMLQYQQQMKQYMEQKEKSRKHQKYQQPQQSPGSFNPTAGFGID